MVKVMEVVYEEVVELKDEAVVLQLEKVEELNDEEAAVLTQLELVAFVVVVTVLMELAAFEVVVMMLQELAVLMEVVVESPE